MAAQTSPAFRPLVADPREGGSSIGYLWWTQPELDARVVAVGIGDAFSLFQVTQAGGRTVEAAVGAVVLAQFNGSKRSFDFVNADFIVGLPLAVRSGPWSGRARLYHWSSHLGDEFLLATGIERFEVSLGALELLAARDHRYGRVYAGGELWFARVPSRLPTWVGHAGLELRGGSSVGWMDDLGIRGLAAFHLRAGDFGAERPLGVSSRAGLEMGRTRPWAVLFDYYDGPSPHGQFFDRSLRWYGVSIRLTL
ncbi:MAG: DUF1207 domain-containing protein [Gemmatimonadota bacterium]